MEEAKVEVDYITQFSRRAEAARDLPASDVVNNLRDRKARFENEALGVARRIVEEHQAVDRSSKPFLMVPESAAAPTVAGTAGLSCALPAAVFGAGGGLPFPAFPFDGGPPATTLAHV